MTGAAWTFEAGAAIARERAGGLCEVEVAPDCGRVGEQTHHRQPRGMGGAHGIGAAVNRPSCLVRVCLSCHAWVESNRTAAEVRGLIVRRPTDPSTVPMRLSTVNGRGVFLLTDDGDYIWQDVQPEGWSAVA